MDEKELARELRTVFMQEAKERLNSIITTLIEIDQQKSVFSKGKVKKSVFCLQN